VASEKRTCPTKNKIKCCPTKNKKTSVLQKDRNKILSYKKRGGLSPPKLSYKN